MYMDRIRTELGTNLYGAQQLQTDPALRCCCHHEERRSVGL